MRREGKGKGNKGKTTLGKLLYALFILVKQDKGRGAKVRLS